MPFSGPCAEDCPWPNAVVEALETSVDLQGMVGNAMHCRVVGFLLALALATTATVVAIDST
eukprot:6475970-Amphidinium_carterae.1